MSATVKFKLLAAPNKAIEGSTKILGLCLDFAGKAGQAALSFALDSNDRTLDSLKTSTTMIKDAYADAKGRGALTDKILIGSIAMAGLVAIAALRKG